MKNNSKTIKPSKNESAAALKAQAPSKKGQTALLAPSGSVSVPATMESTSIRKFPSNTVSLARFTDGNMTWKMMSDIAEDGIIFYIIGARLKKADNSKLYLELRDQSAVDGPSIFVSLPYRDSNGDVIESRRQVLEQVLAAGDDAAIGPCVFEPITTNNGTFYNLTSYLGSDVETPGDPDRMF